VRATLPALALGLAFAACGPGDAREPGFDLTLATSAGLLDFISGFQVAVVTKGSSLTCAEVQLSCLKDQVEAVRFVRLKVGAASVPARFFPLATDGSTQDLTLAGLPVGTDYALVIEAISREPTPRLAGSGCTQVPKLVSGVNALVTVHVAQLDPFAPCDPTIK
jgi:hypothetical protein